MSLVDYSCFHASSWIVNLDNHYNNIFQSKTDILYSNISSNSWEVHYNGILNYDRVFTGDDITTLNARPNATTDFPSTGQTSAVEGSTYVWGDNIK